ncbi:MAG: hypothetical protein HKP54_12135 [Boseongicola sp.]|nr:hypothetical protein [Boseongicola sp.]
MLIRTADRRAGQQWTRTDRSESAHDPFALKDLQSEANRLSRRLSQALRHAQSRLSVPLRSPANTTGATQTDWSWRPDVCNRDIPTSKLTDVPSGTRITADTALFHDCTRREVTLHPSEQSTPDNAAARTIEVRAFEGTYLSLATDLPKRALHGLGKHHIVALDVLMNLDQPLKTYARINLCHGPNTDHIVTELPDSTGARAVEFDLACLRLDETRLHHAWLDLIFEAPAMSRITLHEMALHRRPRAEV